MTISANTQAATTTQAQTGAQQDRVGSSLFHILPCVGEEFESAWAEIEARYGDADCRDPITGETWRYFGTIESPRGCTHIFRHFYLFGECGDSYEYVPASLQAARAPAR